MSSEFPNSTGVYYNKTCPSNFPQAPPPYYSDPSTNEPQIAFVSPQCDPSLGHSVEPHTATAVPKPKDFLAYSIVCCLLFFPLGMIALVFSIKTRKANNCGDLISACRNSLVSFHLNNTTLAVLGLAAAVGGLVAKFHVYSTYMG
ncbi:hypothetical protein FKM82_013152 [Ascaphus truei]